MAAAAAAPPPATPIRIGTRRELLVDHALIAGLRDAALVPGAPVDAGVALTLDRPWEGAFCAYTTAIADNGSFRLYYRGIPSSGDDGNPREVTCCAESADGVHWSRPSLDLHAMPGAPSNNVILAGQPPFSHNFSPLVDPRPGVPSAERYKAIAGVHESGLFAFVSADGLRWRKLREQPVLPSPKEYVFDSQNVAFWSAQENRYVLYYRSWRKIGETKYRWVSRASSEDFVRWRVEGEMEYDGAPPEHLYTNQTSPYFRAPHIYAGVCARFMPGRQVLTAEQARALRVDPDYFKDCSDAVLVTSRGGLHYQRTFPEAFLRPGVGLENWVSRSNYPALNLVQTGPSTMSFYVNRNYGQPTAYVRRYELRLDGLASVRAGYGGGELITHPLIFEGRRLELNYSTSAAGSIRVEVQDAAGAPIPGLRLEDGRELIGDEISRICEWKSGADLGAEAGRPVRLRVVLKDADLYAYRFTA
ncbi:MAG: hypothetical protein JSU00_05225 [Acidobacteria bacterium]|nr:hypothetical protein [Acidobacteriota bacterium]